MISVAEVGGDNIKQTGLILLSFSKFVDVKDSPECPLARYFTLGFGFPSLAMLSLAIPCTSTAIDLYLSSITTFLV